MMKSILPRCGRACAAMVCSTVLIVSSAAASEVKVGKNDQGHLVLLRDGTPYLIRGAGGWSHLALLKEHGGNSIRTWGIETLELPVEGKRVIDRCAELDITVAAGIYVGHERHGFDYSDPAQINRQREAVRAAVRKYKDHPALLVWDWATKWKGRPPTGATRAFGRNSTNLPPS